MGSLCEGTKGQPHITGVKARKGVCYHFVFTGSTRGEEGKGLRRDGRRNEICEGLDIPGCHSRDGVSRLEHGKDAVLGAVALGQGVGRGGGVGWR
jgi:hypothetical protein